MGRGKHVLVREPHRGRTLVVLTVVAMLAALLVAVPVTAAPPGNPFVGSWEAPDSFDESHQHMTIGGGPNMRVTYVDDAATLCLGEGYGFVPARARGFGEMTDSTFEWTGDVYCMAREAGGPVLVWPDTSFSLVYDSLTETLWDGYECWYRSGHPESCD